MQELHKLLKIMADLRDPENGCPWDVAQSFDSIAAYTVEEAYEVADAIERKDMDDLKNELGDLLFQVVFHAQMAAENKQFDFVDVVNEINNKLVRRHPHVFADDKTRDAAKLYSDWEKHKKKSVARKACPLKNRTKSRVTVTSMVSPVPCRLCAGQKNCRNAPRIMVLTGKIFNRCSINSMKKSLS